MRVSLFVTCLVDQLWPSVGEASVKVLERAGCEVSFDARQTCCGQPAYNSGYKDEARRVVKHFIDVYDGGVDAIVIPSGSCAAMVKHAPALFEPGGELRRRAEAVAARTHELGSFLVHTLGVEDVGAAFEGKVAWHDACHGLRELGIHDEPRRLIANVRGTEFVEMDGAELCCGFGGTFSVKYPEISTAILDRKLEGLEGRGIDALVSGDVSCLAQIGGRLERLGSSVRTMHLAELLASGSDT